MDLHVIMWIAFGIVIATVLALDLFVLHKKPHAVSLREAMIWSGVWIAIALAFGGVVALLPEKTVENPDGFGIEVAQRYLAGYVIELALSVDNLFVFAVIFTSLGIKREHQHKLLFWGVFGALVLRAIFIFVGAGLVEQFHWLMYFFGGILIFTGIKLLFQGDKESDPSKGFVVRTASRLFPVKADVGGPTFWIKVDGKRYATMLFVGLILVEVTDVLFAIDSVPAVLTVALDPVTKEYDKFIVYSSNAFAIMGLRSLYFALAGIMAAFRFLKYGLAVILCFVGVKMIGMLGIEPIGIPEFKVPISVSLGVICGVLAITILLSLAFRAKIEPKPPREIAAPPESPQEAPSQAAEKAAR